MTPPRRGPRRCTISRVVNQPAVQRIAPSVNVQDRPDVIYLRTKTIISPIARRGPSRLRVSLYVSHFCYWPRDSLYFARIDRVASRAPFGMTVRPGVICAERFIRRRKVYAPRENFDSDRVNKRGDKSVASTYDSGMFEQDGTSRSLSRCYPIF